MRKELDLDYDITCTNLVDVDQQPSGWEIEEGEFFSFATDNFEKRKVLRNGKCAIFKSKDDGRYVLEVETDDMEVEYFYSFDINDLV